MMKDEWINLYIPNEIDVKNSMMLSHGKVGENKSHNVMGNDAIINAIMWISKRYPELYHRALWNVTHAGTPLPTERVEKCQPLNSI